jgi:hypothetical protein
MRPSVALTLAAMRPRTGSLSLGRGGCSCGGFERRSRTRRTVLWVVPQSAAVARRLPSSAYVVRMSNCSLAVFTMGVLGAARWWPRHRHCATPGLTRWSGSIEGWGLLRGHQWGGRIPPIIATPLSCGRPEECT